MKFVRHGCISQEKPGIIDEEGNIRDLSSYLPDIYPKLLCEDSHRNLLQQLDVSSLPLVDSKVRLGICVAGIGKIICVGLNSKLHAEEMGVDRSQASEPIIFMKPPSSLSGPNDPVVHTRHTKKLDWEGELAIVIGKQGKYIPESDALNYVFGYACFNDLSERYLQFETQDMQFTKGKCFDGAGVLGPYLVTKSEIADAHRLQIKLWVNDILRQDFNTSDYIFQPEWIISYLSQYFTLYPGDVISMGTGPGSARGWGDNYYLRPGDKLRFNIQGLGEQNQTVTKEV